MGAKDLEKIQRGRPFPGSGAGRWGDLLQKSAQPRPRRRQHGIDLLEAHAPVGEQPIGDVEREQRRKLPVAWVPLEAPCQVPNGVGWPLDHLEEVPPSVQQESRDSRPLVALAAVGQELAQGRAVERPGGGAGVVN